MREVARREAMEPMRVQCLNVATNQTASITVMAGKVTAAPSPFADTVCFAGVPVDGKDWHEDLAAMEEEATLVVT